MTDYSEELRPYDNKQIKIGINHQVKTIPKAKKRAIKQIKKIYPDLKWVWNPNKIQTDKLEAYLSKASQLLHANWGIKEEDTLLRFLAVNEYNIKNSIELLTNNIDAARNIILWIRRELPS